MPAVLLIKHASQSFMRAWLCRMHFLTLLIRANKEEMKNGRI